MAVTQSEAQAVHGGAGGTEPSLYDAYSSMFECILADTDALVDECYRLRYQVYCLEQDYLVPDPEGGEYERDTYDGQSVHALLRHRQTGEFIGTVRVIMGADTPKRIPAFDLCDTHHIALPEMMYRSPCAEISRFCIAKSFRRRVTDSLYATAYTPREMAEMRSRIIPFMAVGLMGMAFKICADNGIHHACAVMEPSLIRMLAKLGIHFTPVGAPIHYHGERLVTYIRDRDLLQSLEAERPDVFGLITRLL